MSDSDLTDKPPFWKTSSGKNALIVLAIVIFYPFVHSFLIKQSIEGPAPEFSATYVSGESFDLKDYQGQPVLIHFWATWCEICEVERPDIEKIAERYQVINVAIQSGSDKSVLEFAEKSNMNPGRIVNDKNQQLETLYGAHAVPASFIVDAAGEIRYFKHGYSGFKKLNAEFNLLEAEPPKSNN